MIRNTLFNQGMSGGFINHFIEYDGYLFVFDNDGYTLYHGGYCCRLGSDEFWNWVWNDSPDFILVAEDFRLWNDAQFLNMDIDMAKRCCKFILEDLIKRELL